MKTFGNTMLITHRYFYFKNALRAHMERTALERVPDIVYTMNRVTILMEPVPTVVKMDTKEISVIPVRRSVNVCFYQFSSLTLYIRIETSIYTIFLACEHRRYGKNCSHTCSKNCKTCRHTDGRCSCYAGWSGSNCSFGIYAFLFLVREQTMTGTYAYKK